MRNFEYFGPGMPYLQTGPMAGRLIVVEGSDGVGRSTQISLLREWLELEGFGVVETGWARSQLVAGTIQAAKEGHTMNVLTFSLLYATDLADRLEHEILPALKAGFIVLSDRYVYNAIARARVRKADDQWIRDLFGFAIKPNLVLYLKADVDTLLQRLLRSRGLDYWEAGLDQYPGLDPYEAFQKYQARLLREYNKLAQEFEFVIIDAHKEIETVRHSLRKHMVRLLNIPPKAPR
jgi:dTMP kinase